MTDKIAFRYDTTPLSDLTYSGAGAYYKDYVPLLFDEGNKGTVIESGTVLSGRNYQHRTRKFIEYNITISADQLLTAGDVAFFQEYWTAPYIYVAFHSGSGWSNFVEVSNGGGVCPMSYVDGNYNLPEITMKLTTVQQVS